MAALLIPALLGIFPMPADAARSLTGSLTTSAHVEAPTVGIAAFLRSIVPTNPFAAAANDALLPLILFTAVFAVALARLPAVQREPVTAFRSEEHTSELQSLMRISYAVFCLQKKKQNNDIII